jgi:hypothetical protein
MTRKKNSEPNALLAMLAISSERFRQCEGKPIREAFAGVDRRIERLKKTMFCKKLAKAY